uniref:Uncharacterized protein n=1 Tax=Anopheles culicifacies TaxID=139723 RepID=A0A182MKQ0_9DIPT
MKANKYKTQTKVGRSGDSWKWTQICISPALRNVVDDDDDDHGGNRTSVVRRGNPCGLRQEKEMHNFRCERAESYTRRSSSSSSCSLSRDIFSTLSALEAGSGSDRLEAGFPLALVPRHAVAPVHSRFRGMHLVGTIGLPDVLQFAFAKGDRKMQLRY